MFSPGLAGTIPPMVSVFNSQIGWASEAVTVSAPASAAYHSASGACYYPVQLAAPCIVRRVWWANGATVSGGATIEVGVYADSGYGPGTKIISGSATQGTASEVQFVDVTDTALTPGVYWIAVTSDSATDTTLFRSDISTGYDAAFMFEEASASPLPATATPVESTNSNIYLCGFSTTASP